jgi:hypothetical protein
MTHHFKIGWADAKRQSAACNLLFCLIVVWGEIDSLTGDPSVGVLTRDAERRSMTNIVNRPTLGSGKGYHLAGHMEIMVPLLCSRHF